MAKKKVLITDVIDNQGLEILQSGAEVICLPELPGRTLLDTIGEAHGILVRGGEKIDHNVLEKADNLLIIAKHGVGYDNIDVEAATRKRIPVTNTPMANFESVAEHNLGFMLSLSKNIGSSDRALRQGKVKKREVFTGIELEGKTLGIVGLGRTGSELARKCNIALSMPVVCYDPYTPKEKAKQLGYRQVEKLDIVLQESDYVAICVPLTKETANFIGARELTLMKPTSFLVNSSRGNIVDEMALYNCLKQYQIAGAAMDVFTIEPPLQDNPLLSLENFIGSPHLAGVTEEAMKRMATTAAEEIMRVFQGQRPKYPVNPEVYGS